MPMIEPMFAAAAESMTPSSKQRTVSSAIRKRYRSWMSPSGTSTSGLVKCSRRPGQSRFLPPSG